MIDLTRNGGWVSGPPSNIIENLERLIAREETNRNLIKGLAQRVDALERGMIAPPPDPPVCVTRPEDV